MNNNKKHQIEKLTIINAEQSLSYTDHQSHFRRANKNPYRQDGHADKDSYRHEGRAYNLSLVVDWHVKPQIKQENFDVRILVLLELHAISIHRFVKVHE